MAGRFADVLVTPIASMISETGRSIAVASRDLNKAQADMVQNWPVELSKAGVMPTFFHMQDVQVELKLTLQIEEEKESERAPAKFRIFATPLNAKTRVLSRSHAEGSSQLKVTFAPGPVPLAIDPASEE